jgi:predicted small secreted protein
MRTLLALTLMLTVTACSTVAGIGKDVQGAAEWTHDKMSGTSTKHTETK